MPDDLHIQVEMGGDRLDLIEATQMMEDDFAIIFALGTPMFLRSSVEVAYIRKRLRLVKLTLPQTRRMVGNNVSKNFC
ncbi:MAG: hypothetical protein LH679_02840 [Cyanobacteria bacterium CAN_BIN43]|nr:hypothetical protein [Cyanobacteria bacterium CAN_BIN43]